MKTFGRVRSVDTDARTIEMEDPNGSTVKCVYTSRVTASNLWSYALVTGVCAVEEVNGQGRPLIRPRSQSDIQAW